MNPTLILNTLPVPIQMTLQAYAKASHLVPQAVIEFALMDFLDLDRVDLDEAALQAAIERYQDESGMPSEVVIELAIAHFLDPDSVTFEDCQPGLQREQVDRLKHYHEAQRSVA